MAGDSQNEHDSLAAVERAALAVHTKFGRVHRLIIGTLEWLLWPLVRAFRAKPLPNTDQTQKILIFEQGHLGDVILLTPFLQSLRRQFPSAHIALWAALVRGSFSKYRIWWMS
jgi:hypothetical protein